MTILHWTYPSRRHRYRKEVKKKKRKINAENQRASQLALPSRPSPSDGSLRVDLQHKLVPLHVQQLLSNAEEGQAANSAQEGHLALAKLEHGAVQQASGQETGRDESPRQSASVTFSVLDHRALREVLVDERAWSNVMRDAGGQVLDHHLHGVARLLASQPQVLLKRFQQRWENRLSCFVRVQRFACSWKGKGIISA